MRWVIREDYLEEIEGDMEEVFQDNLERYPLKKAKRLYTVETLKLLRPAILKHLNPQSFVPPTAMFKHNLIISYRGFLRNKTTFLINLIGLSTGLAGALLIFFWVQDELKMNNFFEKGDQLYQVYENFSIAQEILTMDRTPVLIGREFVKGMPEVELSTVVSRYFQEGKLNFEEKEVKGSAIFASPDFFKVFSYPLVAGNRELILTEKRSIAISKSLAKILFPSPHDALGQTIEWEHDFFQGPYIISGIFEDVPVHSTMKFDLIFHHDIYLDLDEESEKWYSNAGQNFLILKHGTDIDQFNEKIRTYLQPKTPWKEKSEIFVQQYKKKYLHGEFENGVNVGGRISYVRMFSIIAFFILILACINFMNLSTAQASKKMKEIGVKKALGATRRNLMIQFLSESMLMAFLSFLAALLIIGLLLPQFNVLTGKNLLMTWDTGLFLSVLGIVAICGLLAGSYPALYLSSFDPILVLKGKRSSSSGEQWVRKGLVIFQFTISLIFMVGVVVVHQQMAYTQTRNLGYHRDQVIRFDRGRFDDPQAFIAELKKIPGVILASNMNGNFLSGMDAQSGYVWTGDLSDEAYMFKAPQIGYDVIETLGIEVVMGRSFSRDMNDDRFNIILNESALKLMGLADPIGTILDKNVGNGREHRNIVGVIKDFQYGSIHEEIGPLILRFRPAGRQMLVKIQAGTEQATLKQINQVFEQFYPEKEFDFTFLDDDYQALYKAEQRVAVLSSYFGALAIIISCLGLFGLASFTAERRKKEIGIRKILGASVWEIVGLLSRNFSQMVVLAILIGIPISYVVAQRWLDTFAYQIELSWWHFGCCGLTALLIAWLTIGYQTLMAAKLNPADNLSQE